MRYQICCIGHITLDKVVTTNETVFMPGGTAYYFSHAIANFCNNYLLVTAIAESEMESVTNLKAAGINVKQLPSKHTVFFENTYGNNPNDRSQRVLQQADAFRLHDVRDIEADIFHLGPLLANDIPNEMITALAARGKVSLDVQGLLRKVEGEKVAAIDWEAKKEILPAVHFLKAAEEEMRVLTGCTDVKQGAKVLAGWGAKEVIITLGSRGSIICSGNKFCYIPAYKPGQVVDATGCGDTYMAGYLSQRVAAESIQQAGEFAAAMATAKIESHGPFRGAGDAIERIIRYSEAENKKLNRWG